MKLIASYFATLFFISAAAAEWENIQPMPTPREGMAAVALDGKIYVIGGKNETGYNALDIVEIYDIQRQEWNTGSPMLNARIYAAASVHDGLIYVFGGRNGSDLVHPVEIYNPMTGEWSESVNMMPRREGLTATTRGDSILVIAGKMNVMYSSHTSVFNIINLDWDASLTPCPIARAGHGAAKIGDSIYIIGGVSYGMLSDVSILTGSTWTTGCPLPSPLGNTSAATAGDTIYVVGGNSGNSPVNTVYLFTPSEGVWKNFTSLNEARENHCTVSWNGILYVIGGTYNGNYLSSVETFNLNQTVVEPKEEKPVHSTLQISNYPNPFSQQTSISIVLPAYRELSEPIIVYDITGSQVWKWDSPGYYPASIQLEWDGRDLFNRVLPSGVYFIRISSDGQQKTSKISIVR